MDLVGQALFLSCTSKFIPESMKCYQLRRQVEDGHIITDEGLLNV